MEAGTIGGIIGGVVGFAGGIIGCYFSIKNTRGPHERAFMVRVSVVAVVGVILFLIGLVMLPRPYNFLMWIPYAIALPLGIRWSNRRQLKIRTEEAQSRA